MGSPIAGEKIGLSDGQTITDYNGFRGGLFFLAVTCCKAANWINVGQTKDRGQLGL